MAVQGWTMGCNIRGSHKDSHALAPDGPSSCITHSAMLRAMDCALQECGVLGSVLGGDVEMVSYGPTILGAHSPGKRVKHCNPCTTF